MTYYDQLVRYHKDPDPMIPLPRLREIQADCVRRGYRDMIRDNAMQLERRYHRIQALPEHWQTAIRESGKLPAYAEPGGYPILYLDAVNNVLCPKCATDSLQETSEGYENELPVTGDVYWEGPPLECDRCMGGIESAYGDPDEESEEG